MVSKNIKTLLTIGAVIVGGYFLYKTVAPLGLYQGRFTRGQAHPTYPGITLYPSMAPVGGVYPSPSPFREVAVF